MGSNVVNVLSKDTFLLLIHFLTSNTVCTTAIYVLLPAKANTKIQQDSARSMQIVVLLMLSRPSVFDSNPGKCALRIFRSCVFLPVFLESRG